MRRLARLLLVVTWATWATSSAGDDATSGRHARHLQLPTAAGQGEVAVYIHAHLLDATDRLQDGPEGTALELQGPTLLIWVDQGPQYRFVHPTAYVLISGDGVKVVDGQWWPVLNGQRIAYGKQGGGTMISPRSIPHGEGAEVLAYFYPEELGPGDVLADGEEVIGTTSSSTFLTWVDMLPAAYFTHPTVYILVSADKRVVIREGRWWPVLNGKQILFGNAGTYGVTFPFWLR